MTKTHYLFKSIQKIVSDDPVLQLIGNTPSVQLSLIIPGTLSQIHIKLEGSNPSGSLKDRSALFMLQDAIIKNKLRPGMRVLDASSGNMASAITLVAKRLGFEASFVLGNTLTKEKEKFMKLFGVEIINFDGNTWEASKKAAIIAKTNPDKYCFVDQFHNKANLLAHYQTTGAEIFNSFPDADVFLASLGSGGSLCGVGRYLRENKPDIKIFAVTAENGTRIPGLRNLEEEGFFPPLADMDMIDDIIRVNETEAFKTVQTVLDKEGILLGHQGGAVICAALQVVKKIKTAKIVALIGDTSWKNMDIIMTKLNISKPEK